MKSSLLALGALTVACAFNSPFNTARAQGTGFTYQGRLNDSGACANGRYDLVFSLYDVSGGGSALAGPLTNSPTDVANGVFTVTLDFGNQFSGAARWLEIAVRTNGGGAFSSLSPRQALTPAPYAVYSATASSANSVAATNIAGTIPAAQLPLGVVTNGAGGVSLSGTFSGDGSGLTGFGTSQASPLPTSDSLNPGDIGSVVFYGDSLTYGTGGTPYPQQFGEMLHIPPLQIINLGVNGSLAEYIYTNEFLPHSNYWGYPSVFWLGNNNNGANSNNIIPYVSNIISRLRTTDYVFTSLLINTNGDASLSTDTTNFNRWLSNYVGTSHYFDARAALSRATNGSATDALFASQGWTPYSLLSDHAHPNTAGYRVVATALQNSPWLNLNRPVSKASVMREIQNATTTEIFLSPLDAKVNAGFDVTISTMYPTFSPVTTALGFIVPGGSTFQTLRYTMPVERLGGKTNIQISMQVVTTNQMTISYLHGLNILTSTGVVAGGGIDSAGTAGTANRTNVTWLDAPLFTIAATNGYMGLGLGTSATPAPATFCITGFRIRAY